MGKLNYMSILIGYFLVFYSCSSRKDVTINDKEKQIVVSSTKIDDTLYADNLGVSCVEFLDSFNVFYQIAIPEYYGIRDTISIIQEDVKHCFILLEPVDLINSSYNCKPIKRRKLVYIIIEKGIAKINQEFENLVTNSGGVSSQFNRLNIDKNALEIKHQFGNRYNWTYSMFFSYSTKGLELTKVKTNCFSPSKKSQDLISTFRTIDLNKINIDDTMKNNCGCDKFW